MNEHERHELVDPDVAAGEAALNWARQHGSARRIAVRSVSRRRAKRRFLHLTAGVLGLVTLMAAGVSWRLRPLPRDPFSARLPSAVAVVMPATQVLPDGSVVELKAGAQIEVNYAAVSRQVILRAGAAHFTVMKDAARPFVVMTGAGLEVRAVGTAFSVQLGAQEVEVLVTEGQVAVEQAGDVERHGPPRRVPNASPGRQTLATIEAGNRVVLERAGAAPVPTVHPVSAAQQDELLSWRVPRIELTGATLSEVIPVFNRYASISLALADGSLGALEVSGVLRPNNPNALLHVLKVEYGLEAERRADGGITLRRP